MSEFLKNLEKEQHVLMVSDSRVYVGLAETLFSESDVDLVVCVNGAEATESVHNQLPGLVMMDMQLLDGDGMELCRQLRGVSGFDSVPVFLMSSDVDDSQVRLAMAAGVTEVLDKTDFGSIYKAIKGLAVSMMPQLEGHVLYVEDDKAVAGYTIGLLKDLHLTVDHFPSAEEAVDALLEGGYDVVITDIMLEGKMTGIGLIREIRASNEFAMLPVLAVTGSDDAARKVEILRSGANDYVTKPVIPEEFGARVRNLANNKKLLDQIRMQQQKLHDLAITDQLTGIYNRHYLFEVAAQSISNARRRDASLSLMVIDLDHFKSINDSHGHEAGDIVLSEVGALLRGMCREGDIAARFGGEELVALLVDCDIANAEKKAEAFRTKLEAACPAGLTVTASIGVAGLPDDDEIDFKGLFRLADEAMYAAKLNGRNRVVVSGDESSPEGLSEAS